MKRYLFLFQKRSFRINAIFLDPSIGTVNVYFRNNI